jgi:hypothetical protein
MRDKQNFNISEELEQEIKDHFYKDAENLIYWWCFVAYDICETSSYQGLITKELYNRIMKMDKNELHSIDMMDEYNHIYITIKELKFDEIQPN